MNSLSSTRITVISAFLILPALLLTICGVLYSAFGLDGANNLLGSILPTPIGKVFLSGGIVLGGVFITLALNLWAICQVHIGADTGRIYITFYVARIFRHLIFAAFAMLLAVLLLAYAFVENFSIVAR
jgi:hypothetical protein